LVERVIDGSLRLDIAQPKPLAQAADVHRAIEARATTGKQILVP
jgi:NADPH2:quinone reductase